MRQNELVEKIAAEAKIKNRAAIGRALKTLVAAVRSELQTKGKFALAGVGVFKAKERKERKGRNPKTGESLTIPAGKRISFKPAVSLKKALK
jgi:DNA-binding protein HU-beta